MNHMRSFLPHFVATLVVGILALIGGFVLANGPAARAAMEKAGLLQTPEIPATFNYQGFLREPDGTPSNGTYEITATIYKAPTGVSVNAPEVYKDTFSNVNVRDGLFNIVLGDQNPLGTAFESAPLYIGIDLNDGQGDILPRERLHSVPWALHATNAQTAQTATFAQTAKDAQSAQGAINAMNAVNADTAESALKAKALTSIQMDYFALDNFANNTQVSKELPNGRSSFSANHACLLTDVQFGDSSASYCKVDGDEIRAGFESFCAGFCIQWGE